MSDLVRNSKSAMETKVPNKRSMLELANSQIRKQINLDELTCQIDLSEENLTGLKNLR